MEKLTKKYEFKVLGKVKAKQSVKFAKVGNFMHKYTPKDMVDYANWVKVSFREKYPDALPSDLEDYQLKITLDVLFNIPKSFSKKKRELAQSGIIKPTVKPDWDNISKNICDALNGVAYPDDKAIVTGTVNKIYSTYECVKVCIEGEQWIEK